jgi:hypothetical protein
MNISELTFNDILTLEFLHDNKNDIDAIKNGDFCYNMIMRKKIEIDTSIKNPEQRMKEYIFKNINYDKLKIRNTDFSNNITNDDKIILKDTIILVFDNNQLHDENINLLKYIFKDKIIKIFIPFIFLSEQLLKNETPDRIKAKIDYYKLKFINSCNEIIVDNYFTDDNILNEFYIKESEDIGFVYDDIDDKLINYNIFSNTNENKKMLKYQLNILYKYFNNINLRKRTLFNTHIKKLKNKFETYFIINDEIKNNIP